jgi:hypothetical protein
MTRRIVVRQGVSWQGRRDRVRSVVVKCDVEGLGLARQVARSQAAHGQSALGWAGFGVAGSSGYVLVGQFLARHGANRQACLGRARYVPFASGMDRCGRRRWVGSGVTRRREVGLGAVRYGWSRQVRSGTVWIGRL